jgi:hypothetical protein
MPTTKASSPGWRLGYRSGLEEENGARLQEFYGEPAPYETVVIRYRIERDGRYTPDFPLHNGIVVETKGRFLSADRAKHKLIKVQHPDLDIRFVFSNPRAKLGKRSKTTYADWCERNGFKWASRTIPDEWLEEPINRASLTILHSLGYDFTRR